MLFRSHAKITTIEKSKDIDKIHLIELVGNLQTCELGLTRIGKSGKGKSTALKAKSSDTNESSNDEDSKMKSYITRQFEKFRKNANVYTYAILRYFFTHNTQYSLLLLIHV